jgi:GNAT superfamily N-acetyltransferase
MDNLVFRSAAASDSRRIAALHVASWRSAYRGSLPDAYLDGEAAAERLRHWDRRLASCDRGRCGVILAERENDLAGFVCALLDEEPEWGACVDNLHVRPDLRGLGLGRRLLREAAAWVRAQQPDWPLHLWVFEANQAARRFYESAGGRVAERAVKPLPGGVSVASLRYFWDNAGAIAAPAELAAVPGAPAALRAL